MDIGIVGLGRMGNGVALRLLEGGHRVVAHNRSVDKIELLMQSGAEGAPQLEEIVEKLTAPRTVWLYLPSGDTTEEYIQKLADLLSPGDTIIDGGNSRYTDTVANGQFLSEKGLNFLDVGTSGGIAGRKNGYCLMIGGDQEKYDTLQPLWQSVAQQDGYKRMGSIGSGHYTKMVHNAIEYGMMQAYGEGLELLATKESSLHISLKDATEVWQKGSIIQSFLGQLLSEALQENPTLTGINGLIADSGEGKWALQDAIDQNIATPVMTAALYARYASRMQDTYAQKTVNILRNKFGGHVI
jgi:6-phosphogluconate dehydrogenase